MFPSCEFRPHILPIGYGGFFFIWTMKPYRCPHNDNFPAGRIAGLIRVSTDKQDNDRQKKSFSRFETQHGLIIAPMFEDVGARDKADKREQF